MKRVFISYSRQDQVFARQLTRALEDVGADVWVDFDDIPAGAKWSTAIQDGLDSSDGMLVIISPDAMRSPNVEDEWQYFMDHGNPVIPILYQPAKVHFQLHRLQHIDFSTRAFGDAFAALLDELEAQGVPLKFEEAEETVKFGTPAKTKAPESKEKQQNRSYPVLIGGIVALAFVVLLAFFLIWNLLPDSSGDFAADFEDSDLLPPPLAIEINAWEVHVDPDGTELYSFDNTLLHTRFFDNDYLWVEVEDIDKELVGYQTTDMIPTDQPELLTIVPMHVPYPNEYVDVFTEPYYDAGSLGVQIDLYIRVHGFFYDDDDQLWYYVTVFSIDHNDIITGWINESDELPDASHNLLAALAYINADVEARWHFDSEDIATTIPEGTLVYILYAVDDFYGLAYYLDDIWELLFIPQSEVDVSDTTAAYID